MKPTDENLPNEFYEAKDGYVEDGKILFRILEQQGYELIKPTEGMCYIDGEWQRLEQYQERFHAHYLCDETCPHPLYRLIPLEQS